MLDADCRWRSRAAAWLIGWAALFAGSPLWGQNNARDAVINLEAYAAYKAGDYGAAREIWQGLAERGNTTALINLANLFQQGQGVSEDQRRALRYIERAAHLGDERAQYELGMAYETGTIVERDIDLAASWLRRSAEGGSPEGQFAYGVMLATARGAGLTESSAEEKAEAVMWLRKARGNGHLEASEYIDVLDAMRP